jgi:hypothetical protein
MDLTIAPDFNDSSFTAGGSCSRYGRQAGLQRGVPDGTIPLATTGRIFAGW